MDVLKIVLVVFGAGIAWGTLIIGQRIQGERQVQQAEVQVEQKQLTTDALRRIASLDSLVRSQAPTYATKEELVKLFGESASDRVRLHDTQNEMIRRITAVELAQRNLNETVLRRLPPRLTPIPPQRHLYGR